jgi:acyl dehydratase
MPNKPAKSVSRSLIRVEVTKREDEKERVTLRATCNSQKGKLVLDGKALVTPLR